MWGKDKAKIFTVIPLNDKFLHKSAKSQDFTGKITYIFESLGVLNKTEACIAYKIILLK